MVPRRRTVAVGGDAVGPDDHRVHQTAQDRAGRGAVDLHHVVDAVGPQLPCGEAGALQQRPGLVDVHDLEQAAAVQFADDPERGAPRRRRQRAGVAVGEQPQRPVRAAREQPVGAQLREPPVRGLVLVHDPAGLGEHRGAPVGQ
jgi:hypothetical protein